MQVVSFTSGFWVPMLIVVKLDQKWYLEWLLAMNRARREQKASESTSTTAKRKLDSMIDAVEGVADETRENPAKRVKVDTKTDSAAAAPVPMELPLEYATTAIENATGKPTAKEGPSSESKSIDQEVEKGTSDQLDPEEQTIPLVVTPEKPIEGAHVHDTKPAAIDFTSQDGPKTSGPVSSTGENQDFNFDSMFDDPGDAADPNAGAMSFDMDVGTDPFANAMSDPNNMGQGNRPTSMDSLLPGLEMYANQTSDDPMMNFNSNGGMDGMGGMGGASTNIFDLPDLGDSTFDDLLDDDGMGGGLGNGSGDMLNDDSMMNMGELDNYFS